MNETFTLISFSLIHLIENHEIHSNKKRIVNCHLKNNNLKFIILQSDHLLSLACWCWWCRWFCCWVMWCWWWWRWWCVEKESYSIYCMYTHWMRGIYLQFCKFILTKWFNDWKSATERIYIWSFIKIMLIFLHLIFPSSLFIRFFSWNNSFILFSSFCFRIMKRRFRITKYGHRMETACHLHRARRRQLLPLRQLQPPPLI